MFRAKTERLRKTRVSAMTKVILGVPYRYVTGGRWVRVGEAKSELQVAKTATAEVRDYATLTSAQLLAGKVPAPLCGNERSQITGA